MSGGIDDHKPISTARGLTALSPVIVFMALYVAVSLLIGDFYRMPISVAMMVAGMVSIVIYRGHTLTERIECFSREAGHVNILYMIWVFVLAGAFASLAREIGAVEATVNLILSLFPAAYVVPMLFFAACFISFSIGTSVGTVVALTPLAVETAHSLDGPTAFFVAAVLGGAFFGDNLSFISDTTIAATRSQECDMRDKFRVNLWIALPAALVTVLLYVFLSANATSAVYSDSSSPWLMLPYLLVIVTAAMGINVTVVLSMGLVAGVALGIIGGYGVIDMAGFMGKGIESMGELIVITLIAAGMLGIIKNAGGIGYLLQLLSHKVSGRRGAQAVIAALVAVVNLCTANNTVAIITVGPISREISRHYGVDPRKAASLLDSVSCIVQCLIPYGAQTLLAASLAGISPVAPFPYLYYPWALAVMVALSIIFQFPRRYSRR